MTGLGLGRNQLGALGQQFHGVSYQCRIRAATQMPAQLQGATDVGACDQLGTGAGEVVDLDAPQLRCFVWLHQVVDAGAAAADPGLCGFPKPQMRDGLEQLPRLASDALAVNHVTGIVIGHGKGASG